MTSSGAPAQDIRSLAILGAAGDLTARSLLPALAELQAAGRVADGFGIIAVDRDKSDTETFQRRMRDALERHARHVPPSARRDVVSRLVYRPADVTDPAALRVALDGHGEPLIAYLALPPAVFEPAVAALGDVPVGDGSRVVVEKPFGSDLASAQALDRRLHDVFGEERVHRVDHFLGKQTVQNLLGLRFANRVFEPLWNRDQIERVEIAWDETLSVGDRAGYYDSAGALRDMVQNHLLQVLALVGMEVPLSLAERDFRDRKLDVLRAVAPIAREDVARRVVRGRYVAGAIDGRDVPSYVDEPGVDAAGKTETFAAVVLEIESWRWAGVPFHLRSGKALAADRREIVVHFRPVPHLPFGQAVESRPNRLRLHLDPDAIELHVNVNGPGDPFTLEEVELDLELAAQEPSAYARVFLDVLAGDPTLSIRADEAEESWRIAEPIVAAWESGSAPLLDYTAGSFGPDAEPLRTEND